MLVLIRRVEENSCFEKLSADLKQLWQDEKFCDVQFSVEGRLISAHKTGKMIVNFELIFQLFAADVLQ
jgi:hypothetical protein